jgi:hypothetical protein
MTHYSNTMQVFHVKQAVRTLLCNSQAAVNDQRTDGAPSYSNTLVANLNARRSLHVTENIEAASTAGAVLSDPQVVSLGLWPEPSGGMSVLSETAGEQVCHGPSNGSMPA